MNPTYNLIESSIRRTGLAPDMQTKAMQALVLQLQNTGNKLMHVNNSVFMVSVKGPGEVEVHTFSQESPQQLARNYVELARQLKELGVKTAKTYSDDPRFQQIAKMTGLPVKIGQTMKLMGREMKPMYEYTLEM